MNISLVRGSTTIVLNGSGAAAPLRGARFASGVVSGPHLVLEIALDGTPSTITTWLTAAELLVENAARFYALPGEDWGFLQVTIDSVTWRTPIERAAFEYASRGSPTGVRSGGAAVRALGSQGLLLKITRPDYWEESSLSSVPLTNRNGAGISVLDLDNHTDSADDAFAQIASDGVGGDVPTPAWVQLVNTVNGSTFYLGQAVTSSVSHGYILEAEDGTLGAGVTGASTADAACSGGNYRPLSWSGAAAVTLLYWDLGATATGYYAGRIFRPLLRLRDLISGVEKFWLWWRVGFNVAGTIENIQDFEGILCSTSQKIVPCPPMPVPPWPKVAGFTWESATLSLMCQAEGSGAHAINLDFVQMQPTEGWLVLSPVVSTITNSQVTYDAGLGVVSRTATAMASHLPEGPGLELVPGVAQTIHVLSHSNGAMVITTVNQLRVQYRKRKRAL